jgi:tetratricopeptide (TPR) repeat protein
MGRYHGTTPLSELLAWQDARGEQERRNLWFRGHRAGALAMLGRSDEARVLLTEVRAELAAGSAGLLLASMVMEVSVTLELLADDPAAAALVADEAYRLLEEFDYKTLAAAAAGWVGQANYALGRLDEAIAWADRAADLGASETARWRQVKAKVLARRGEHAEAERLAHQAVETSDATDILNEQGAAYADLAEVLALGGNSEATAEALKHALARYERKENIVMAQRVRARLAGVQPSVETA